MVVKRNISEKQGANSNPNLSLKLGIHIYKLTAHEQSFKEITEYVHNCITKSNTAYLFTSVYEWYNVE